MCGITGKLWFEPSRSVSRELLARMTDVIAHRGPDAAGYYVNGAIGLGHRRLSIIDLATGDQPLGNEDGSVQVVFNGEIYNFAEVRDDLLTRGHQMRTRSDTEVIVHAFEEWGDACVDRFRGRCRQQVPHPEPGASLGHPDPPGRLCRPHQARPTGSAPATGQHTSVR